MTEFFKRVATIAVLVFILALLFLYGSNTSLVVSIYLVTLLSFHEWLRISSKSKYYIFPFFILIPLPFISAVIIIIINFESANKIMHIQISKYPLLNQTTTFS